ncbi:MAG: cofactor-independent phosphoglycerate mutase [Clostridia bacterium]
MKYVILVGDGMADLPVKALDGKTPLQIADKPAMDYIAAHGINGMCSTVPDGMVPESDTANLAIMGYDPKTYSKGRSPLEALSIGIDLKPNQTAIRANLVSVSDLGEPYKNKIMIDHSSDEISTDEARVLIEYCDKILCASGQKLYTGVSYRHCFVYDNAPEYNNFGRPHDILGRVIGDYLPNGTNGKPYLELMKASFELLNTHPINIARAEKGLKKANSLWFWSPGKKPSLPDFKQKTGLDGAVICAVDLIKGIGICAGLSAPAVEGATGTFGTNYSNKMLAAFEQLKNGKDFVYIHVEAPDECGHRGEIENKIRSIEKIDSDILYPLIKKLDAFGERYKILLLPDHPTPLALRTHTLAPIPFVIYDSGNIKCSGITKYDEQSGVKGNLFVKNGDKLIDLFLKQGDIE